MINKFINKRKKFIKYIVMIIILIISSIVTSFFYQEIKKTKDSYDAITQVLECGYYIVGMFAFIALINGFQQNKLLADEISSSKSIALDTFKRETASMTVQVCKEYAKKIIPVISDVSKKILENNTYAYTTNLNEEDFNDEEKLADFQKKRFYEDKELYAMCATTANELEAYSMYFTEKICDEYIAFKATGQTFVTTTNCLYPFILYYRAKYRSDGYSNLIKLYTIWNSRLNEEKLTGQESELEKLEQKLRKDKQIIKQQKRSCATEKITPIGLNDK